MSYINLIKFDVQIRLIISFKSKIMKKLFLIAIVFIIAQQSIAQDKIIELNGKITTCKVSEIADNHVKYSLEDEDFLRNISKMKVEKIVFSTGKTVKLNERKQIKDEKDWQNVIITDVELGNENLVPGEEIEVSVSKNGRFLSNRTFMEEDAIYKVRKMAAARGYSIVMINKIDSKILRPTQRGRSTVKINATGYTYK